MIRFQSAEADLLEKAICTIQQDEQTGTSSTFVVTEDMLEAASVSFEAPTTVVVEPR